jgi:carbamate kinase
MSELVVVALGGNALIRAGQRGTIDEQAANLDTALAVAGELIARECRVLVTHGNGPQVGHILLRAEAACGRAYDLPLDVCVAQSQGETGYLIEQRLEGLLRQRAVRRRIAAVVTRTVVDLDDPAFRAPTKPIGPFYTADQADALRQRGVAVVEDAHRGFRRVVPSPAPLRIVETEVIRDLAAAGTIVIAAGGGGIPVSVTESGALTGVEAVVDKDLSGGLLAAELGATRIIDLTSVEYVQAWFGTARERPLERMTTAEAKRYMADGHFLPGSMQPKMEAAIRFLDRGGREFIVTTPERAIEAIDGRAGTHVVPA